MSQNVQGSSGLHNLHMLPQIRLRHQVPTEVVLNSLFNDQAKFIVDFKISIFKMESQFQANLSTVQQCLIFVALPQMGNHLLEKCFCRHCKVRTLQDLATRAWRKAEHHMPVTNVDEQKRNVREETRARSARARVRNACMEQEKETGKSCEYG